jgi:hypothetical protein
MKKVMILLLTFSLLAFSLSACTTKKTISIFILWETIRQSLNTTLIGIDYNSITYDDVKEWLQKNDEPESNDKDIFIEKSANLILKHLALYNEIQTEEHNDPSVPH